MEYSFYLTNFSFRTAANAFLRSGDLVNPQRPLFSLAWLYTGYETFRREIELIPTGIWSE